MYFVLSFSELLEKLCVSLYDVFRPLIIHVIHLETLSELCGILKNEVLEDHVQNNGKYTEVITLKDLIVSVAQWMWGEKKNFFLHSLSS